MQRDHGGTRGEEGAPVRVHPHPVYFSGAVSFAGFVAIVTTLLIRHNDLPSSTNWAMVGWGTLVAASGFLGPLARWSRTWVELDRRRVSCSSGLIRHRTVVVDLDRARGMTVEQSPIARRLQYAKVRVVDESGTEYLLPPIAPIEAFRAAAARTGQRRGRRDG